MDAEMSSIILYIGLRFLCTCSKWTTSWIFSPCVDLTWQSNLHSNRSSYSLNVGRKYEDDHVWVFVAIWSCINCWHESICWLAVSERQSDVGWRCHPPTQRWIDPPDNEDNMHRPHLDTEVVWACPESHPSIIKYSSSWTLRPEQFRNMRVSSCCNRSGQTSSWSGVCLSFGDYYSQLLTH